MKVWIDLANSPHPLLFSPIAERLRSQGAEVRFTVRDHAQTRELALARWPDAEVIGAGRLARPRAVVGRARALARWARGERPDVALSHNAYAQILAARRLGIPAVTAMDYEHQPANHLAFRLATTILLPEAIPAAEVRRQGARERKVIRYPGLKEEIYLADFEPDPGVLAALDLELGERGLAVARAAPEGAAYHRGGNPIFDEILRELDAGGRFHTVALARKPEQRRTIEALGLDSVSVPATAVDARSLLCEADLFVGAGGTMSREAALLGTPAFSVFAGRPAAVDRELGRRGLLRQLTDPGELAAAANAIGSAEGPGPRDERLAALRAGGERILQQFVEATRAAVPGGPGGR